MCVQISAFMNVESMFTGCALHESWQFVAVLHFSYCSMKHFLLVAIQDNAKRCVAHHIIQLL